SIVRSSVAFTENSRPEAASVAITWRAVGIESCRKPAVAVTISTRGVVAAGAGCWPTAGGDAGQLFDEHAPPAATRRTRAQRRGSQIFVLFVAPAPVTARGPCASP